MNTQAASLKGRDLTEFLDFTRDEVELLIDRALYFQNAHKKGVRRHRCLEGEGVAMIFEKPSLRTKIAFEVAAASLGGTPVFLSSSQILASGQNQEGRESIPDIARNLEQFADVIVARVYHHEVIRSIADSISTPVINALCDRHHPTQSLADLLAIRNHFGSTGGLKVSFVGDGNNVATSLMQMCSLMGMHFSIASPEGFEIPQGEINKAKQAAEASGVSVDIGRDPAAAVRDADVIYADTFTSMGFEAEKVARERAFKGYQVNSALLAKAKPDTVFMHCLPAHRGEEVTDEVMDGPQSIVFHQAGCRLHIAQALLMLLLTGKQPTEDYSSRKR